MRRSARPIIAALLLLAPLSLAAQAGGEVLTNDLVIQMVAGKVPSDVIVAKIKGTKSNFDVSPEGLIALNAGKVSQDNIKLIMTTAGTSANKATLDNGGVVKMVLGGLSKSIIIAKIQMSKPGYDLTTSGLLDLSKNKVSEDVQKAMMASASGTPIKP